MTTYRKHELVELIGPGGRCKVPVTEVDSYLKMPGWLVAPTSKVVPEQPIDRGAGLVVPSSVVINKMSIDELQRLAMELDLKVDLSKMDTLNEKRAIIDNLAHFEEVVPEPTPEPEPETVDEPETAPETAPAPSEFRRSASQSPDEKDTPDSDDGKLDWSDAAPVEETEPEPTPEPAVLDAPPETVQDDDTPDWPRDEDIDRLTSKQLSRLVVDLNISDRINLSDFKRVVDKKAALKSVLSELR